MDPYTDKRVTEKVMSYAQGNYILKTEVDGKILILENIKENKVINS